MPCLTKNVKKKPTSEKTPKVVYMFSLTVCACALAKTLLIHSGDQS